MRQRTAVPRVIVRQRSEREEHFRALRMEIQERIDDYPFTSQEEEAEILYRESVEEEIRRERVLNSRRRRERRNNQIVHQSRRRRERNYALNWP